VKGASFRNTDEVLELAGCDGLTISPALLDELAQSTATIHSKLDATKVASMDIPKLSCTEKEFRWMMNEDPMATEKLPEGIRNFAADLVKLEDIIQTKMKESKGSKK
jgi:transaldolase